MNTETLMREALRNESSSESQFKENLEENVVKLFFVNFVQIIILVCVAFPISAAVWFSPFICLFMCMRYSVRDNGTAVMWWGIGAGVALLVNLTLIAIGKSPAAAGPG